METPVTSAVWDKSRFILHGASRLTGADMLILADNKNDIKIKVIDVFDDSFGKC